MEAEAMRQRQQRVSAGLTINYPEPVSQTYARANLQAAKAIHTSGLSHKEKFDLVFSQLYYLMFTSPNGFAHEFEEVQKSVCKLPGVYVEDVEADIPTNRKTYTPEPATKIDHVHWCELFSEGSMHSEIQADCTRVMRKALGALCPASGLSLLMTILACYSADVVADPDAFVDDVAIRVIKAVMQKYRENKRARLAN
jgi:hypothetical protein